MGLSEGLVIRGKDLRTNYVAASRSSIRLAAGKLHLTFFLKSEEVGSLCTSASSQPNTARLSRLSLSTRILRWVEILFVDSAPATLDQLSRQERPLQ